MGKVVKSVGKFVGGVFKAVGNFVGMLFSAPKPPKVSANVSTETRLNGSLVPEENKKIIFGETACGTDERFWETYGSKNERHVKVYAAAGHELTSFGNLYLEEFPIPFNGQNASSKYAGQLSRRAVLKGVSGAGISIGSGTRWNASASMTGCAYFVLDWVYNQEKMPNGIPSRITQVVRGAKVYDPRRDSTVGGSGSHRADNPDTWEYLPTDSNGQCIGRNNALQMLTYQLGLKVRHAQTNEWILVGGKGVDPNDIEFDTFIVAANNCELEGWYSDMILSTGDDHATNEGIIASASAGELMDVGGRFSYFVATDDTINVVEIFNDHDIVGDIDWEPQRGLGEQYNELPGTFTDPAALFQTRPLPLCWDQAYYEADGKKVRGETLKLAAVQDPVQGQKLLRLQLNRSRLQGVFTAPFNLKALRVRPWSLVMLNFEPFGWVNKLFRVRQQGIATEGGILLVLEEESPSVYLPGAVSPLPPPSASFGGDPSEEITVGPVASIATGVASGNTARDAIQLTWTVAPETVKHTEIRYKKTGDTYWTGYPPLRRDQFVAIIEPLLPTTNYTYQVRHVSLWNVPGPWVEGNRTTNAVTTNPAGQITYADGTPVEYLKPGEPGANITGNHTAAGFFGQDWGATAPEAAASNARVPVGVNRLVNSELVGVAPDDLNVLPKPWAHGWEGDGVTSPNRQVKNSNGRLSIVAYVPGPIANGKVFDNANSINKTVGVDYFKRYGVTVNPNDRVAFSARLAHYDAAYSYLIVGFYRADGSYITEIGSSNNTSAAGPINGNVTHPSYWPVIGGIVTAPAEAAYATIWQRITSNGQPWAHGWMADPMLAVVAAGQTNLPAYNIGPNDRLVDRTVENTSAAIIGQGWGATASEDQAANAKLPIGQNAIVDSDMTRGFAAFGAGWNGPSLSQNPYRAVDGSVIRFVRGAFNPMTTDDSVYDLFSTNPRTDLGMVAIREWGMPVNPGDRIFASVLAAFAGGASQVILNVGVYDGNGLYITEHIVGAGGRPGYVSAAGDPSEFNRIGGFLTISEPNARWLFLWPRVHKPASATPLDAHAAAGQPFMAKVSPLQTVWPPYTSGPAGKKSDPTGENTAAAIFGQTAWATSSEPVSKVSKLKNNGRSATSYQVSNGVLTGAVLSRTPLYVLGSSVNGSAARISIAASSLKGSGITVNYSAGTIDGAAFSTAYYVWIYDPDVLGGTVTYVATTDPNAYIDNSDYLFVGTLTTIASGGTAPAPPPVPPRPPGYYDCVSAEAWLPSYGRAGDLKAGETILMLSDDGSEMKHGKCVANKLALAPCMIFETVSGIKLTCSTTTPILFKTDDGFGSKPAWECDGSESVPVVDKDGFRWEALVRQPGHIGEKLVAHISANDGVYAAGDQRDRYIFTHNAIWREDYVKY